MVPTQGHGTDVVPGSTYCTWVGDQLPSRGSLSWGGKPDSVPGGLGVRQRVAWPVQRPKKEARSQVGNPGRAGGKRHWSGPGQERGEVPSVGEEKGDRRRQKSQTGKDI